MCKLVSVIIPCYNAEKTIAFAIQSVLEQTYRNIEIIVINDGSSDRSADIVLCWSKNSEIEIELINQENLGVSSARNRGIDNAKGEYLFFLDADDKISPDLIYVLVEALKKTDSDTAYCKYDRVKFDEIGKLDYQVEDREVLLNKHIIKQKYRINFFTYLYKKEIVCKNKIRFPKELRYGEDRVFIMSYLCYCREGVFINKALYYYMNNPLSAMNQVNWNMTDNLKGIYIIDNMLTNSHIASFHYDYAFPRAVWALAKDFAIAGRRDLLERLDREFQATNCMKKLMHLRQVEILVKITACLYIINRHLFFQMLKDFSIFYNNMSKDIIRKRKK